jgi:transglutaminase-like putative cysteine protease
MSGVTTTSAGSRPRAWEPLTDSELAAAAEETFGPREGWLTLFAVVLMVAVVAVAIDDAAWASFAPGTRESQTKFLPIAGLFSVLLGAWLAKRPWRPLVANMVGALVGSAYLLYAIANTLSRAPSLEAKLHDLNLSVSSFVESIFVLDSRSSETSVFLLIIGALVWGAGQFAAFNVFRRHRAGPPILLAGVMLLINVSITTHEEYLHLVVFAVAALLLVMRLNLFEQAREWRSRGVFELGEISTAFLRNGATMVAFAIIASLVLAANASSAPLARAWSNVDDQLLELGYDVNRLLGGVTGSARGPNILFTPSQTIRDFWQSSSEEVFSATISDGVGRKWRGATYDSFDGRSWQQLDRQATVVQAGEDVLGQSTDHTPPGPQRKPVSVTVTPASFDGDVFVAPADPVKVDQPTELLTSGAQGPFVAGKLAFGLQSGVPYTVDSTVAKTTGNGQLTAADLVAAGRKYPAWVSRYLDIRPDSVGDIVSATARGIVNGLSADERDPYHIAEAVQDYLYSKGGFQYSTDVRGLCDGQRVVDCFLGIKQGYCEYFATTMVMLLREVGVPARYVLGYLPGHEQADDTWRVDRSAAHAWVEVYFPNYGWVEFDPTPGNADNGQATTHLAEGAPRPSASPGPDGSPNPGQDPECVEFVTPKCLEDAGNLPPDITPPPPPPGPDLGVPIAILALLLAAGGGLAWFLIRRVPSSEPEIVFMSLSRLAGRMGYGPKPAQTTFEYADRLGNLVPVARSDVRLIAAARVEATYARRVPGSSLPSLADAYRRARIGLLRLVVRRPRIGRGPRLTRPKRR